MNHEQVSQLEQVDAELRQGYSAESVAAAFGWSIEDMEARRKFLIERGLLIEIKFGE